MAANWSRYRARPRTSPVLAGPRNPLPPLNNTISAPAAVKRQRFSTGGSWAAASTITGTS